MTAGDDNLTVRIRRSTVEGGDPSAVTELLGSFASRGLEEKRNRIRFEVEGYGEDPRELYEIEEVREFFQRLFEENEGLFAWIDPQSDTFMLLGLMLYDPRREGDAVSLSPEDLRAYLERGLAGLERFCAGMGIPADRSVEAISRFVTRKLGS